MKRIVVVFLIAALSHMPLAFGDQPKHAGEGTVRSVDRTKGEVTLTHGQIGEHKMAGMTMDFKVKDKRLFERLQPGQQVEFEFVAERTSNVIVSVTPVKEPRVTPKRNTRPY